MGTFRVEAPDISCDHCRRTIEEEMSRESGVRAVAVDVEARSVAIDYDDGRTDPSRLRQALAEIGYPPAPG